MKQRHMEIALFVIGWVCGIITAGLFPMILSLM